MPIAEGGRWSPEERIVSPGVFTRENDLSFLPQGVANIGGAIIAPFPKGPAFSPTLIENQTDLETYFGVADGVYYGPYSAKEYLANQGQITVVRVGALGGYIQKNPLVLLAQSATTPRLEESSSLSDVKLRSCVITRSGSVSNPDGYTVSATVQGTFDSGINEGLTEQLGTVSFVIETGSFSGVDEYGWFTSASVGAVEVIGFDLDHSGSIFLTGLSGGVADVNEEFTLIREAFPTDRNKAICTITDSGLFGAYGKLDVENQQLGEEVKVLAVLANTAFDAAQNLDGFSSSVLIPSTTSSVTDTYTLDLNTWGIDVEGNEYSASYGNYEFSIDPTSPKFLTETFWY